MTFREWVPPLCPSCGECHPEGFRWRERWRSWHEGYEERRLRALRAAVVPGVVARAIGIR